MIASHLHCFTVDVSSAAPKPRPRKNGTSLLRLQQGQLLGHKAELLLQRALLGDGSLTSPEPLRLLLHCLHCSISPHRVLCDAAARKLYSGGPTPEDMRPRCLLHSTMVKSRVPASSRCTALYKLHDLSPRPLCFAGSSSPVDSEHRDASSLVCLLGFFTKGLSSTVAMPMNLGRQGAGVRS